MEKAFQWSARIVTIVLALGSVVALLTLNSADELDLQRFKIYALSQAVLDFLAVSFLSVLAWIAWRSKWIRTVLSNRSAMVRSPDGDFQLRNCLTIMLALAIGMSVMCNGFFLLRARAYFWQHLVQKSYVEGTIARVDTLADAGRIGDAYTLAAQAQRVLTEEADQSRISNRSFDLTTRVEISRRLSQGQLRPDARSWNPVTQRIAYFANAEAVRLNPQNFQAAEVLAGLFDRIVVGVQHDATQLCREDGALTFQTVSVIEAETFRNTIDGDCSQEALTWLEKIWQPTRITEVLSVSREVSRPVPR